MEKTNLYIKINNTFKSIPMEILHKGDDMVSNYTQICTDIDNLKENINNYLFDKTSTITHLDILNNIVKIKNQKYLNELLPFLEIDINNLEEKLINICTTLGIDIDNLYKMRDKLAEDYINTEHCIENIIDENYVNKIIDHIKSGEMYSLKSRSRYGTLSSDYNVKNKEDIVDLNDVEINNRFSPILVIHRPAKYHRGTYILEDDAYVYIKRQPLDALIKQEGLEEKGTDSMGAISYIKLDHRLSNENLQELLAEIYVYAQKNNLQFHNIKLSDISLNKVWMTADKLKKEFKELRYYNKNLSQKLKEIYDTTGSYYTQIGGKYIFNSRVFLHNYKTYKDKEIN